MDLHLSPLAITYKFSYSEQYNLQNLIRRRVLRLATAWTCITCVLSCSTRTIDLRSTSPSSQKHCVVCLIVCRRYETPTPPACMLRHVCHLLVRPLQSERWWPISDRARVGRGLLLVILTHVVSCVPWVSAPGILGGWLFPLQPSFFYVYGRS